MVILFLEFLKDSKCCILNGRLNPENDNFTSISVRGKAVADYIVTSHVDMKTCIGFNVYTPSELIDRVGPESFNLIGDHSRLPDHSVLCLRFQVGEVFNTQNNVDCPQQVKRQGRNYPVDFLSSETCRRALLEVIDQLQIVQESQEKLDWCYTNLCNLLHDEMEKLCPVKKWVLQRKIIELNNHIAWTLQCLAQSSVDHNRAHSYWTDGHQQLSMVRCNQD